MTHAISVRKNVPVRYLRMTLPLRYDDGMTRARPDGAPGYYDMIPDDFPGRNGKSWEAHVDIEQRKLLDAAWRPWTGGAFYLHMKVCDEGVYELLNDDWESVAVSAGNYVPHGVVPGEFGDYVHLDVAADGTIKNLPKRINLGAFDDD
jgi:hypothetical protein